MTRPTPLRPVYPRAAGLALALCLGLAPGSARAGSTFTRIAATTGPFSAFTDYGTAINASVTVAFLANLDVGGRGIFTGNGGSITTIADSSGPFGFFYRPSINASGTVAFQASLYTGATGI